MDGYHIDPRALGGGPRQPPWDHGSPQGTTQGYSSKNDVHDRGGRYSERHSGLSSGSPYGMRDTYTPHRPRTDGAYTDANQAQWYRDAVQEFVGQIGRAGVNTSEHPQEVVRRLFGASPQLPGPATTPAPYAPPKPATPMTQFARPKPIRPQTVSVPTPRMSTSSGSSAQPEVPAVSSPRPSTGPAPPEVGTPTTSPPPSVADETLMKIVDILGVLAAPRPTQTPAKVSAAQKSATASAVETRKKLAGKFSDLPLRSIPFVHAVMRTATLEQDYLPAAQYVASTTTNDGLDEVIENMRRSTGDRPWSRQDYEEFCAIGFQLIHGKRWADIIVARALDLQMPRQLPDTSTKQFVQDQLERASPFVWALGCLSVGPQAGVRQAAWLQQWQLRTMNSLSTPGIQQSLLIRLEEAGELGTQAGWQQMLMVSSALEIGQMGASPAYLNAMGSVPESASGYGAGAGTPPTGTAAATQHAPSLPAGMDAMAAEIRQWQKTMTDNSLNAEKRQGELLGRMQDSADKTRHDVSRLRDDVRDGNRWKRKEHTPAPDWNERTLPGPLPPAGPPPPGPPPVTQFGPPSSYSPKPQPSHGTPTSRPSPPGPCFKCQELGHWSSDCTKPESCLRCGTLGHRARGCEAPCAVCKEPGRGRHVKGCSNMASRRPGFVRPDGSSENYAGHPKNAGGQ